MIVTLLSYNIIFFRNINDVDKTMDEINEQTENMKQIQDALAAPIGADFDEVISNNNIYLHSANEILSFD
jgi:cysteinyl-tRNA synthetase